MFFLSLILALKFCHAYAINQIWSLPPPRTSPIFHVAFSADSSRLVVSELATPRILDGAHAGLCDVFVDVDQRILPDTHGALFYIGLTYVISWHGNQLVEWVLHATQFSLCTPTDIRKFDGHTDTIWDAALVPGGTLMVSASEDSTVRLWDINSGSVLNIFQHANGVRSVVVSPDGRWAVSGSYDMTAKVWDIANRSLHFTLTGHRAAVWAVGYTPDGRYILTACHDSYLRLWDATSGTLERAVDLGLHPMSLAVSPDSQQVICGGSTGSLAIYVIQQGTLTTFDVHDDAILSVAYAPNGLRMASCSQDGWLKLWDMTAQDCNVSSWSEWAPCICSDSKQLRTRSVVVEAANLGETCPNLQDFQSCKCGQVGNLIGIAVGSVLGAVIVGTLFYVFIKRWKTSGSPPLRLCSVRRIHPLDQTETQASLCSKAEQGALGSSSSPHHPSDIT